MCACVCVCVRCDERANAHTHTHTHTHTPETASLPPGSALQPESLQKYIRAGAAGTGSSLWVGGYLFVWASLCVSVGMSACVVGMHG